MVLAMELLQMLRRDVRVDLCRREIRMSEKRLQGAKVHSRLEKMSGEGMAKSMRRNLLADPGEPGQILQDQPERLTSEPIPAATDEEGFDTLAPSVLFGDQRGPTLGEIGLERLERGAGERH